MPAELQSTLQIVERLTVSGVLVLIIVIGAWALIAPMRDSKFRVPRLVLGWAHERALEEIAYWRDLAMQQQITINEATRGVVVRAMNEFADNRGAGREGIDSEPDNRRVKRG